jgi:CRISPR-associated protein Csd1
MSWFQKLYETYEHCMDNPAFANAEPPLLPVSHTSQQAHIRVVLDGAGNFLRAELLNKQSIILPATEDSAVKAAKPVSHPLIEKIHYCAKDYKCTRENYFDLYEKELGEWCRSEFTHPKCEAVYNYIIKGMLVSDLISEKILQAGADGQLLTTAQKKDDIFSFLSSKNINGKNIKDQGDAVVCWSVEIPGDLESDTWKDKSLQDKWIQYDETRTKKISLCMVTGIESSIMLKHPKFILRPGDQAKIVSSNDKNGFTFRGKFDAASEACTIGYKVSQKAHNALRWLIARQGYHNGEQTIVAWAVKGAEIPSPFEYIAVEDGGSKEAAAPDPTLEAGWIRNNTRDLGKSFADELNKALRGYRAKLKDTDDIVVLGLDSATPGRLSVTFYRELSLSDYLDKLRAWQLDCLWRLRRVISRDDGAKKKDLVIWPISAPTPKEICFAAYGGSADEKLKKAATERLLPCIVDAAPIPRDLMESCVRRACARAGLKTWEWYSVLGVACALYKGFYARHPEEEKRRAYSMSLDEKRHTRDYLYGRLLAVAEYAEHSALQAAEEKRPANAERLMQHFADHPFSTWLTLEKHINPYMLRLKSNENLRGLHIKCRKLLQNICDAFDPEEFVSNKRLSGEFLLGYHCQMSDIYRNKKTTIQPDEQEGEKV